MTINNNSTTIISTKALETLCAVIEIYSSMVKQLAELRKEEEILREHHRPCLEYRKRVNRAFEKAENDSGTLSLIYDTVFDAHESWLTDNDFTDRMFAALERIAVTEDTES